jgi:ketosteroid isomerase-like protein
MDRQRIAILIAVAVLLAWRPAGARPATAAEREVREAALAVVAAFERGDVTALAARIDPDYRGANEGGAPVDAPRALQAAKQLFASSRVRRLRLSVVGLRVQGELATMTAHEELEVTWNDGRPPTQKRLRQESLWRRGPAGWRLLRESAANDGSGATKGNHRS